MRFEKRLPTEIQYNEHIYKKNLPKRWQVLNWIACKGFGTSFSAIFLV